ncbi:unnamed protein product [Haemonchus placei]|uniref:Ig-like domain-containing protein n=1 Tax=Haemonchus placei TaxID=6290 RepID=A0A0N4WY29_HAEPC|nr:unnamed protein product [Haemonchus placei]
MGSVSCLQADPSVTERLTSNRSLHSAPPPHARPVVWAYQAAPLVADAAVNTIKLRHTTDYELSVTSDSLLTVVCWTSLSSSPPEC